MHTLRSLLVIGGLALAACGGGDDGGLAIAETPLAGKVGGKAWTFVAGHTDAFLSEGEDDLFAELYATSFTTCSRDTPSGGDFVLLQVPKQTGEYELSLGRSMTFVVGGDENLVATRGSIVVDEVTATSVKGGIHARFDDANEIDGQFTIAVCAD